MSGEVILFAVMSIIFLVAIVLIEVSHEDENNKASAEKTAETVSEKRICHSCDYVFTADELKKVG